MNLKIIIKIITIAILLINFSKVNSAEKIVFIDMNKLLKVSLVGKSLGNKLNEFKEKNQKKFQKDLKDLKSKESKLISQKNVLDKKDFENNYRKIQQNFLEYKKSVENFNRDINNKKIKSESFIMEKLRPLLSDYAKKNNISMIINKQNIIIGRLNVIHLKIVQLKKRHYSIF